MSSFGRRLDQSVGGDDRWDGEILDYSKGGGQGAASCRSLAGLLQSHQFLCSYVLCSQSISRGDLD